MRVKARLYGNIGGRPAISRTIVNMRRLVNKYRRHPLIIEVTRRVMRAYNVPRDNPKKEIEAIYKFLSKHVRYTKDPVNVELLQDPLLTLAWGTGDCDDISVLAASMAESIGLPTRFVLYSSKNATLPHHVFTEIKANNRWVAVDTVYNKGVGRTPPGKLELGGLNMGELGAVPKWVQSLGKALAPIAQTGLTVLNAKLQSQRAKYEAQASQYQQYIQQIRQAPVTRRGLEKYMPYILVGGGVGILALAMILKARR